MSRRPVYSRIYKTLINTALEEGVLPKQKVFVHSKENIDKPEKDQIINILNHT